MTEESDISAVITNKAFSQKRNALLAYPQNFASLVSQKDNPLRSDTDKVLSAKAYPAPPSVDDLGWQPWFSQHLDPDAADGLALGRVSITFRDRARVITPEGELEARFSTAMNRDSGPPAVGDWVLLAVRPRQTYAVIQRILPRRTAFSRKVAGGLTEEQVVAANVDTVFLVEPCHGLNRGRLERALVAAWSSGAQPIIVLSKADLCPDPELQREQAERIGRDVPVFVISVVVDAGIEPVLQYCQRGQTIALIGGSGAGKSSLVNRLVGAEIARVGAVRSHDGRGRHTTTHRELIRLPTGGLIIDTPGLRELQLWDARKGLNQAFDDIESLAQTCRFRDCRHDSEQDCAVRAALELGSLDRNRLDSYQKLNTELEQVESKLIRQLRTQTSKRVRVVHR